MKQVRTRMSALAVLTVILSACHKHDVSPGTTQVPPAVPFSKLYGGSQDDQGFKTLRTTDGGYIVVGQTQSGDSSIQNYHGGRDILVIRLDVNGNRKWAKCFGGTNDEIVTGFAATPDGGYVVAGNTGSTDGDVSGNHGNGDVWVLKIDANGNKLWTKCLGGSYSEGTYGLIANSDGTIALAIQTLSNDGDISGSHGDLEACLMKLDANGNKLFAKCYGGSGGDGVDNIVATPDGYIISGETNSVDGDITGNHGNGDIYLLSVDQNGNKKWLKTYGGSQREQNAYGLVYNHDGTIAVAAQTYSNDGDVAGFHGGNDIWFLKVGTDGTVMSSKCFGGGQGDYLFDMIKTGNGYTLVGSTNSTDGDISGNHGSWDGFLLKVDNSGNKQSFTCYGGTSNDGFNGILVTDKTLLLTGYTSSSDGDIIDHPKGSEDVWIHNILQ